MSAPNYLVRKRQNLFRYSNTFTPDNDPWLVTSGQWGIIPNAFPAPDGSITAVQFYCTSEQVRLMRNQDNYAPGEYNYSLFVYIPSSQDQLNSYVDFFSDFQNMVATEAYQRVTDFDAWVRLTDLATSVESSADWIDINILPDGTIASSGFQFYVFGTQLNTGLEALPYVETFSSAITQIPELISVNPDFDYVEEDRKLEVAHRVKSGRKFRYKFGDYERTKFSVSYVNSEFKSICNSWWNSNVDLLFTNADGLEVMSCHITNDKQPVGKPIKPYTNQFRGTIELETY